MPRRRAKNRHEWAIEDLRDLESFFQKPMFGCEAVYLHGRMMLVLADRKPPWRGVLFPTSREHHAAICADFPALAPHPVLGKWLYLPERHDDFEDIVREAVDCMIDNDPRFGVEPGAPRKRKKKSPQRTQRSQRQGI